jgi:hypothetical protein
MVVMGCEVGGAVAVATGRRFDPDRLHQDLRRPQISGAEPVLQFLRRKTKARRRGEAKKNENYVLRALYNVPGTGILDGLQGIREIRPGGRRSGRFSTGRGRQSASEPGSKPTCSLTIEYVD